MVCAGRPERRPKSILDLRVILYVPNVPRVPDPPLPSRRTLSLKSWEQVAETGRRAAGHLGKVV